MCCRFCLLYQAYFDTLHILDETFLLQSLDSTRYDILVQTSFLLQRACPDTCLEREDISMINTGWLSLFTKRHCADLGYVPVVCDHKPFYPLDPWQQVCTSTKEVGTSKGEYFHARICPLARQTKTSTDSRASCFGIALKTRSPAWFFPMLIRLCAVVAKGG